MALATTTLGGAGPLATDDETQRFAMLVRGVIAKVGTQTKASALFGMSQSYLSRVERGVAVRVRRTLLEAASLRLNIPVSIWSANPGQSAHEWALEVLETVDVQRTGATTPLGDSIRAARESVGMSQAELARRAGVSVVTVWRWETGAMSPSVAHAQVLATIGVPFEWLDPSKASSPLGDAATRALRATFALNRALERLDGGRS
jgi:transcriptional regulator with XRE-family HTH domain